MEITRPNEDDQTQSNIPGGSKLDVQMNPAKNPIASGLSDINNYLGSETKTMMEKSNTQEGNVCV